MKLFNFFTKLIKTVAKLLFPEKYHKLLNSNEARLTQPRAGDVHRVGTHPARIPPAAPPAYNANGAHKKPELESVQPVVTEDSVIEECEPLPTAQDVYKLADVQEPASLPLELEEEVAEGVKGPALVPTDIEFSDPQTIEAPVMDVEEPASPLDEQENIDISNVNETEQQSTEVKLSETINEEGLDLPPAEPQVLVGEEPSPQLVEQKTDMILEREKLESQSTEQVVTEVPDAATPEPLLVDHETVKPANAPKRCA